MLKDVRFEGFGSRPDILAHLRELLPDLEHEIGRWENRVEAEFVLRQASLDDPAIYLSLTMALSHSKASNGAVVRFSDIERPADFRAWVRRVWGSVLDELLGQLDKLLEQRAKESELEVMPSTGG
jgi:hypothetical protein